MKHSTRTRLAAAGWTSGTAADFLGLSPAEAAVVEMKLDLSQALRSWRIRKKLTQEELARQLGSSQSRVAKMEAADATVTIDLLVRALLQIGAKRTDIARAIT
jgi:DNA-binding XRE family transcriptional regulator